MNITKPYDLISPNNLNCMLDQVPQPIILTVATPHTVQGVLRNTLT